MKGLYSIVLLLLVVSSQLHAQTKVTHQGSFLWVKPNTLMHIHGSIETQGSGTTNRINNAGTIQLTDSLVNNGTEHFFGAIPDTGKLRLIGDTLQLIIGADSIHFNDLELNNSYDTLLLEDDIWVKDSLIMVNGNVFLNGHEVMLLTTGTIAGEINTNRIYGAFPGVVSLERAFGSGTYFANPGGMGMDIKIDGVSQLKMNRFNEAQAGVANGSIERFYEITPVGNGTIDYPATFYYFDANDLGGLNEDSLHLYGSSGGITWRDKGGTVNTAFDRLEYTEDSILDLSSGNKTYFTLADSGCLDPPSIVIPEDTIPICSGDPAWLVADSTAGKEIIWSDISGNILSYNVDSIQVTGVDSYVVMAIDSRGCDAKDTVVVSATADPTVSFSEAPVCLGTPFNFSPSGTSIAEYAWEFGVIGSSSDTSSLQNPSFTYSQPNTYTVTLTVTSGLGCEETYVQNVIVKPYPTAGFIVPDGCADSTISFVNTSSDFGSSIPGYTWEFDTLGSTGSSTLENPTFSYAGQGTYTVELVVSLNGCNDTAYQTVSIYPNPQPNFTYSGGSCPNDLIAFDNTTPPVGMVDYEWDFGDGSPATNLMDPDHSFSAPGTYSVVLTASTNKGCVNDTTIVIIIDDVPDPAFSVSDGCEGSAFSFIPTTVVTGNTYSWDFGDGNTDPSNSAAVNTYAGYGTYNAELIVTSANGCKDSSGVAVEVFPNPVASFTVEDGCEGTTFDFFNTSTIFPGSAATLGYNWSFPGGTTSTNTNETLVMNGVGTNPVELITTSLDGCKDTVTVGVEVFANPVVAISGGGPTCGDSSLLSVYNPGAYLWSNGSINSTITASFDGVYSVIVTSPAPENCLGYDTVSVDLDADVIVDLGPDTTICNSIILNAGYDTLSSTILWSGSSIGPGTDVTDQFLEVTTSGTYTVSVTDQNGCDTTDVVTLTVNQSTPIDVATSDTVYQCQGVSQMLSDGGVSGTYTWSTGQIADTIYVNSSAALDSLVTVVMENTDGCFSYDTVLISFNPAPLVDFGFGLSAAFCDSVVLDATNTGASYIWYQNNVAIAPAPDSILLVTDSALYSVVAQLGSCSDSVSILVDINTSPTVELGDGTSTYGTDTILCSYQSIVLDAGPGADHSWSTSETTQSISVAASGTYYVLVTDVYGCTGTDSIDVTVNPVFEVDLGGDQVLCVGSETTLFSGVPNGTYEWYDSGGIIGSTENIVVSDTGLFWIDMYDEFGCRSIDSVVLLPTNLSLYAVFLVQTDVYVGDSVKFVNLSYPRPYDSHWKIINHTDGSYALYSDSTPVHVYTGDTGRFDALLIVSNSECIDSAVKEIHVTDPVKVEPELQENLLLFNEIEEINLYPNPNNGEFNLYLRLKEPGTAEIMIFNMMGQLLDAKTSLMQEETLVYQMKQRAGMYIVRVRVRESVKTVKFIMLQ